MDVMLPSSLAGQASLAGRPFWGRSLLAVWSVHIGSFLGETSKTSAVRPYL